MIDDCQQKKQIMIDDAALSNGDAELFLLYVKYIYEHIMLIEMTHQRFESNDS
jgi:hypothetical protein